MIYKKRYNYSSFAQIIKWKKSVYLFQKINEIISTKIKYMRGKIGKLYIYFIYIYVKQNHSITISIIIKKTRIIVLQNYLLFTFLGVVSIFSLLEARRLVSFVPYNLISSISIISSRPNPVSSTGLPTPPLRWILLWCFSF